MEEVAQMNWGAFKPKVADAVIAHLEPIQAKYTEVMSDPAILDKVVSQKIASFLLAWQRVGQSPFLDICLYGVMGRHLPCLAPACSVIEEMNFSLVVMYVISQD